MSPHLKSAPFILCLLFLSACEPADMILIPAGEFRLGSVSGAPSSFMNERTAGENAHPQQNLHLQSFYLDKYEVTYENFIRFKPRAKYQVTEANEPMRGVSWYEADAYCLSIGKRLPTEFEWEKAARGPDDRKFVWGNEFHRDWANFGKTVRSVGSFPKDVSPYGVHDMNGNVSEWTASWYRPYPGSTYEDENFGEKFKVIRGGTIQKREHGFMVEFVTLPYRNYVPPKERFWDTGFRCARNADTENGDNQ